MYSTVHAYLHTILEMYTTYIADSHLSWRRRKKEKEKKKIVAMKIAQRLRPPVAGCPRAAADPPAMRPPRNTHLAPRPGPTNT